MLIPLSETQLDRCGSITLPRSLWQPGHQINHPEFGPGTFIGRDGDKWFFEFDQD